MVRDGVGNAEHPGPVEGGGAAAAPDAPSAESPPPHTADKLIVEFYAQLRELANRRLQEERPGHTLQPTALVNEVYAKLSHESRRTWASPAQFFSHAAEAMRQVLIDHARQRGRIKRGGGQTPVRLPEGEVMDISADQNFDSLIDLEDSICRLEKEEARLGRVVRLRFYVGLTFEQIAEVLGLSTSTVKLDWQFASQVVPRLDAGSGRRTG